MSEEKIKRLEMEADRLLGEYIDRKNEKALAECFHVQKVLIPLLRVRAERARMEEEKKERARNAKSRYGFALLLAGNSVIALVHVLLAL